MRAVGSVELAGKVAALRLPETYGAHASPVEAIETHLSWVFLTESRAYKLKKPVCLPYLDYRTLEARQHHCQLEVELNRRLAHGVYLGVVPLMRDSAGRFAVAGTGEVVDWLVCMRRLPAERMLDRLLAGGALAADDLAPVSALLTWFYTHADAAGWSPPEYRDRLAASVEAAHALLSAPVYRLPAQVVDRAAAETRMRLAGASEALAARAGRVVDAHGDLRPEHICLEPSPVVIDCLEFDRELRLLDPLSELSFLAVECTRLGGAWIGRWLREDYMRRSGDHPGAALTALVDLYPRVHALLRATVAIRHLDDGADAGDRWRRRATQYLDLAGRPSRVEQ